MTHIKVLAVPRARLARMDYFCPMHTEVRQGAAGNCPKCGMPLCPAGTRFAFLRHMASNPLHLAVMAAAMLAIMAAAMMMFK